MNRAESVQRRWNVEGVSTRKTPGHIYFVQADTGGLVKIGWATKPAARVKNMQMVCPVRLVILLTVAGNGAMEKELHTRFAHARQHGEWFEPTPEIFTLIEEWRTTPPPAPVWPEKRMPAPPPPPKPKPVYVEWEPGTPEWERLVQASKALE